MIRPATTGGPRFQTPPAGRVRHLRAPYWQFAILFARNAAKPKFPVVTLEQVHFSNHKQRLARHLGTTREVVARLLGDLVAHDVVQTRRGAITIRDRDVLDHLAISAPVFKSH